MRGMTMRIRAAHLVLAALFLLGAHFPSTSVVHAEPRAVDVPVYIDALVAPWENYSYGSNVDFASDNFYLGSKGLAVTYTEAFGALSLHHPTALNSADYRSISFWAYGAAGDTTITLSLGDAPTVFVEITLPADTWSYHNVLLSELGVPATFQRINWQDNTGAPQPTYYLDHINILAANPVLGFPDNGADDFRAIEPGPSGIAIAPNGRVYVAVYKDDRVYSWPSVGEMFNDVAPDKTFGVANGDPDVGCTNGPSATVMCGPESVAVDDNGNLFVADTYNHRVLVFYNPDTDATPLVADAVLGQANLTSGTPDYDSVNNDGVLEGFCFVRGLALDANNNLWVVDEFNYRVVRFDTPTASSSLPSRVLGQADLDDQAVGCAAGASGNSGAAQFSLPLGVAVDEAGNIFVADLGNNRVQRFAAASANGADAEASYVALSQPHDVAVDADGNLYVSDTANSRVVVFAGGADGDLVFDHLFPGRNFPMGMAFTESGDFLVADCGAPLENTTYPPCLAGTRGVYLFSAPAPPQYQPPVAVDDNASTPKGMAVQGNVLENDSDAQATALTVSAFTQPGSGAVTVETNGDFTYTPQSSFVGEDSFSYTVSNIYNLTDTATVRITVVGEGDPLPPNAVNDSAQTATNTPVSGNVLTNDSDPQGRALTVSAFTQPSAGNVEVAANGVFTFTPATDFVGMMTFGYTVRNTANLTDSAVVSIHVVNIVGKEKLFMPLLQRQGGVQTLSR